MDESSSEAGSVGAEASGAAERPGATGRGSPGAQAGGSTALRVGWTLLPIGVWLAGTLAPLPGVDTGAMPGPERFGGERTSLLVLGVIPLLTGWLLVEGAAAAVPGWRPLRRTRRGRGKLALAALVVTLGAAAYQGWGVMKLFESAGALVSGAMFGPLLSIVAATAVLWAAIQAAEARGLGSPLALVMGLGVVWEVRALAAWPGTDVVAGVPPLALFGGMSALAMGMTLAVLKTPARDWRAADGVSMTVRIPPAGLFPLLVGAFGLGVMQILAMRGLETAQLTQVSRVAVLGALFVGLSWGLYSPSRVGAAWATLFERGAGARGGDGGESGARGGAESGARSDEETRGQGAGVKIEEAASERGAVRGEDAEMKAAYAPSKVLEAAAPLPSSGGRGDPVSPERLALWTGRARGLLVRAMLPAVAYLGLVMWPEWPVMGRPAPGQSLSVVGLCVAAAAALDAVSEWRFRRAHGEVAAVAIEQRLFVVDAALSALEKDGVAAVARSEGVRTLLSVLAPFAPVEILVPAGDAERARARIAAVAVVEEPEKEGGGPRATGKTAGTRKAGRGRAKGT